MNKPYSKLYAVFLGIFSGLVYQPSRKLKPFLRFFLYLLAYGLFALVVISPYPAQVHPMAWSDFHNAFFVMT